MTCLGIHYGTAGDCILRPPAAGFLDDRSCGVSRFNRLHSVSIPKLAGKPPVMRVSVAATMTPTPTVFMSDSSAVEAFVDDEEHDPSYDSYDSPRVSDKIDEWMRNSVTEIVKNIRQAPLLVQIYANGVVKTEKAVTAEDWRNVVSEKPSSSPDGIILVEELRDKMDLDDSGDEDEGTKAFGVVIQGKFKGRDRVKSSCYLLKTCSVNGGLGPFCTHFCLMKVHSFSKSASAQLNDCWLLP
ncbi:hypothetical protein HanPI659440_Chr08g0293221 [Helianthus annuus]|nr:hypothetical protein HanPI659440_Chr08g0293221 [Helianthus annuus]